MASALFVKGRHTHPDNSVGHFHLQITAAGLDKPGTDSEAELFKKVPDVDTFAVFRRASDTHIVITIRGIGEMEPQMKHALSHRARAFRKLVDALL